MKNPITIFEQNGWNVRAIEKDGEPWFVAKDVAESLGYANSREAIRTHCKKANDFREERNPTPMKIIPESDLYRLIMRSKLPEAERFETWVVEDVLPSIRKTGTYQIALPKTLPEALRKYADEVEAHEQTKGQLIEAQPKVEFVEKYVESSGLFNLTQAAKNLKFKRKDLIECLLRDGRIFRRGKKGKLEPYVQEVNRGILEIKTGTGELNHAYTQMYITAKGMNWIAETYATELGE